LRADENVLIAKEIERAASAAEFLTARERAGLGCEGIDRKALLAEARRRFRRIVQVAAVQAAIDMCELVTEIADLEVAPQRMVLVAVHLDVELAERRCDVL